MFFALPHSYEVFPVCPWGKLFVFQGVTQVYFFISLGHVIYMYNTIILQTPGGGARGKVAAGL